MCHGRFQGICISNVSLYADDGYACLACDLLGRSQNLVFGASEKGNTYAFSCKRARDALAYSFAAPAN